MSLPQAYHGCNLSLKLRILHFFVQVFLFLKEEVSVSLMTDIEHGNIIHKEVTNDTDLITDPKFHF